MRRGDRDAVTKLHAGTAPRRSIAKGKGGKEAAPDRRSARTSKAKAPEKKKPTKPATTNGHATPAEVARSSALRKRRHDATESPDGTATTERRSKKSKTSPEPQAAKKKAPLSTPKSVPGAHPVINTAPTKVLSIFVFGTGECGELGLGPKRKSALNPRENPFLDPNDPSKFHVVQLACGGMHTIALTRDNKIVTWGVNEHGALGRDASWDGGLRDVDADSGSDDDEDLNPFESTPTEIPQTCFPPGTKFVQVAAGDSCSFALTDTGLVFGWGTFIDSRGDKQFGYTSGKRIKVQEKPTLIPGLEKVTQIACRANHALALDTAGVTWGWGIGEQNQLGRRPFGRYQETLVPRLVRICRTPVKYIASGEYHSFAVDSKDNVWGWGLNSFGEAGHAKSAGGDSALLPCPMKIPDLCGKGVTVIDGGSHHSAAITEDGQCLVWGRMDGGQLEIQSTPQQLEDDALIRYDEYDKPRICLRPTPVPVGRAVDVSCGTDHTIFLSKDGKGYSTGFGSLGQLGLGSEDDQDVVQEMSGKKLGGRILCWTGAGGQFSIVAAAS